MAPDFFFFLFFFLFNIHLVLLLHIFFFLVIWVCSIRLDGGVSGGAVASPAHSRQEDPGQIPPWLTFFFLFFFNIHLVLLLHIFFFLVIRVCSIRLDGWGIRWRSGIPSPLQRRGPRADPTLADFFFSFLTYILFFFFISSSSLL